MRTISFAMPLVLVALTACSVEEGEGVAEDVATASRQGDVIVSAGRWSSGMAAAISGPIARVGSCIGIDTSPVIWPEGTRWDPAGSHLTLPSGTTVTVDDEVHGGGGFMKLEAVGALFGQQAAEDLAACGATPEQEVTVFNVGGTVHVGPFTS